MRWLPWLLVAACATAAGPAVHPRPPPPEPASSAPAPPDDRECDELITHAVALGIDEQAARPSAPQSTLADHEAVRRALHDDFMAGCRALPRDAYRCAMAAPTLAALSACQEPIAPRGRGAQRTPSSSTSNSSVAPGGITPPAPRSP